MTGVTTMQMDEGLDTGDMILKTEVPITKEETGESLHDKLAQAGADVYKRQMIRNATKDVYVLADHTKIGKNSSFTTSSVQRIGHLITDEKAPEEILKELENLGVKVHQVHKEDF